MKASAQNPAASFSVRQPARRVRQSPSARLGDQEDDRRADRRADQGGEAAEKAAEHDAAADGEKDRARQRQRDRQRIDAGEGGERRDAVRGHQAVDRGAALQQGDRRQVLVPADRDHDDAQEHDQAERNQPRRAEARGGPVGRIGIGGGGHVAWGWTLGLATFLYSGSLYRRCRGRVSPSHRHLSGT